LFAVHTRENGTNYNNTIVARQGNVGIGVVDPGENLVVGQNIGSYGGNRVIIGDVTPGVGTGLVIGEDSNNRSWILWNTDDNTLSIGSKEAGVNQGNAITIGGGTVELFDNAIEAEEILDEPGIGTVQRESNYYIPEGWGTMATIEGSFPTAGYAVIIASAQLHTHFSEFVTTLISFAIADSTGFAPTVYQFGAGTLPWSNTPGGSFPTLPIAIHEVMPVAAGTMSFRFICAGGQDDVVHRMSNARMTVMFFPTAYGTVDAVASAGGDEPMMTSSAQPMLFTSNELPEMAQPATNETDQVAALRAEFETERNNLRSENAKLVQRLEVLEELLEK